MYIVLEVLAVMPAAVTMSLALSHALELPGKLRLGKDQHLALQTIYDPGFLNPDFTLQDCPRSAAAIGGRRAWRQ